MEVNAMATESNPADRQLQIESSTLAMQGSLDWTTLTDSELGSAISESFSTLELLSRKAQAELRNHMLPALREVRRRFNKGQLVGGYQGIEDFYRSIGVNANTIYSWERRARLLTDGKLSLKTRSAEFIVPTIEQHGFELDGQTYFAVEPMKGNFIWIMPDAPSMADRKTGRYRLFYYLTVVLNNVSKKPDSAGESLCFSTPVSVTAPDVISWLQRHGVLEHRLKNFLWLPIEPTNRLIQTVFNNAYDFEFHNPQLRRESTKSTAVSK
jgi:hypothetical protein